MSRHFLLCHDIDQANGSGTMSQHFESLSQHKEMKISDELCHETKDNPVATKNSITMRQVKTV